MAARKNALQPAQTPAPGQEPRPICVLSVGRSGTSLAARALNLLGVYLGPDEDLIAASPHNATGFWEHRKIYELNEELLARLGGSWYRPPTLSPGWAAAKQLDDLRQRGAKIVDELAGSGGRWGFKDARTVVTLAFWQSIIGPMDYVICVRSPHAVSSSIQAGRNMFPDDPEPTQTARLWLRMNALALRESAVARRTIVFYEDWFVDPHAVAQRLTAFVHGENSGGNPRALESITACFDPSLSHSGAAADDDSGPAELDAMYAHMRLAAGGGAEGELRQRQVLVAEAIAANFEARQRLGSLVAGNHERPSKRPSKRRREDHVAEVVRDQRLQLERLCGDLDEHHRDRVDAIARRMIDVESFLHASARSRLLAPARRAQSLLVSRMRPRIGTLVQHEPRPLRLPKRYWRTKPPAKPASVSIVTPSLGQGQFIEQALLSVISQAYPGLEYIVQDGGSTDKTVRVLRHHERALTFWESETDSGQGEALNRGFARTSGEIMAYLNSDDLLLPGSLAYVARYFEAHPEIDVVYGQRVLIDDLDRKIGIWVLPPHDDKAMTLIDPIPQETVFWRRRIWEAAGGEFDTTFKFAIDWDLLLRFRDHGARFAHVPRFLGAFRVHDNQKTTREQALCEEESHRLRQRVHDRPESIAEALASTERYLRRHVRAHNRQRLIDRLPITRTEVTQSWPVRMDDGPEWRTLSSAAPASRSTH